MPSFFYLNRHGINIALALNFAPLLYASKPPMPSRFQLLMIFFEFPADDFPFVCFSSLAIPLSIFGFFSNLEIFPICSPYPKGTPASSFHPPFFPVPQDSFFFLSRSLLP